MCINNLMPKHFRYILHKHFNLQQICKLYHIFFCIVDIFFRRDIIKCEIYFRLRMKDENRSHVKIFAKH